MKKPIAALLAAVLVLCSCVPALGENTKHERVYIVTDSNGKVQSLTDNIRLENREGLEEISDVSLLTGIENMSGSETFTRDGDALIWKAQGNDIIYQGTSDQVPAILPVVSLTLDGEIVTAAELKDRTGEAVLSVTYRSDRSLSALALTMMPLPVSGVTDIQVENAMIVSEAGQRLLVGYAVPGVDAELELPDHFTVSFHADHADLSWMMTLISADPIRLAYNEMDGWMKIDPQGMLKLADSILTSLQNGEDLPMLPGFDNIKTNIVLGQVNSFFHSLTKLDEDAQALSSSAAGIEDSAQALRDSAMAVQNSTETLRSALNGSQTGGDSLNSEADALLNAVFQSANVQLAALGLNVPELTVENYAELLKIAAKGMNEETTAKIAALETQLEQTVHFVDELKVYTGGVVEAARSADALNTAVTALTGDADALHTGVSVLRKDADDIQKDGTAKVKSTIDFSTKQIASLAMPYVQKDIPRVLDLYGKTRDLAQNCGYDLRPEGMQTVTVFIIRTDLQ